MLKKYLENIGLNNKEASVYLAALEIGSNPVSKIAAKAKINRVTTYDIIEKLTKKGLMSSFTRAKVKFFTATDPEVVIKDFQRKVEELSEKLPDLQRLSGETVHPRVRYFEGLDGIRHIYEDTLSSKTEILNYGASEEIRKAWPTYDKDYVAARAEKKIFLRGITPDDNYGKEVVSKNKDFHREIRTIPKDKFDFSNEIHVYDNKVAIISFKDELIGMIIESPEIAHTQRAIFKMVWEFSKKKEGSKTDTPAEESRREAPEEKTPEIINNAWKIEPEITKTPPTETPDKEINTERKHKAIKVDKPEVETQKPESVTTPPKPIAAPSIQEPESVAASPIPKPESVTATSTQEPEPKAKTFNNKEQSQLF